MFDVDFHYVKLWGGVGWGLKSWGRGGDVDRNSADGDRG